MTRQGRAFPKTFYTCSKLCGFVYLESPAAKRCHLNLSLQCRRSKTEDRFVILRVDSKRKEKKD